jgi:hypothetical protein
MRVEGAATSAHAFNKLRDIAGGIVMNLKTNLVDAACS